MSKRLSISLPDPVYDHIEAVAASIGCSMAEVFRHWATDEFAKHRNAAPVERRDARFAPPDRETYQAKRERLGREKREAEAHLYQMRDGGHLVREYGPRGEVLSHYTWEEALEEFRRTLVVPGPDTRKYHAPTEFDLQLMIILGSREAAYQNAGVEPPDLPPHLAAYKAACPHDVIGGDTCEECGEVPYVA
jgi:hypothetical protein